MKRKFIFVLIVALCVHLNVSAYDSADITGKISELKTLLSECTEMGLECPYEEMQITVMEQFTDPTVLSNTDYVSARIDEIYTDTKEKLESFIEGTLAPLQAPKYLSSSVNIDGKNVIANTTWGKRPVFLIGYGHFQSAADAFPIYSKLGANIAQQEMGTNRIVVDGTIPFGWNRERSSTAAVSNCNITTNYDINHVRAGEGSVKLEMGEETGIAWTNITQEYAVEPNTTYTYSLFMKADTASAAYFTPGTGNAVYADKTDDFKRYSGTFTTTSEQTSLTFKIMIDEPGVCYVDHVSVLKKGSSKNLINNGAFELDGGEVFGENNEYAISTEYLNNTFIPMLQSAEENNVAVSVLLSPHYFPTFVKNYHPEMYENGKVNIFHEEYIAITDKYIEVFINAIKDYKSVHNITLTNEPNINTARFPSLLPDYQAWLKTQYGSSIANLNTAYGTSYTDFSEIPFPAEATEGTEPVGSQTRYFYDWMIYNNKKYAAWHEHLANEVKKHMPDAKVNSKMQDYFDYDSNIDFARFRMTWGTEAEDFAEFSDIMGNDSATYWSWDGRHIQGQMKWYDYLSSLKEAPVFNSEDHIVEDYSKLYDTKMARFTGTDIFQGAIHGRAMSAIWTWEQTADENSLFSGNVLQRPDFMVEIGKRSLDLNRLAHEVTALSNNKPEMAIMYSNVERVYNKNHFTIIDLMYKASLYSGQRVSFVTDTQLDEISKYKMIIVPNVTHISSANLAKIQAYKANGGKVMLVGDCFTHDEFNKAISPDKSGYETATLPKLYNTVLPWSKQIYNTISDNSVKVCDSLGNLVDELEWSYVKTNNGVLVNICNYSEEDISGLNLWVDGEIIEAKELVSDTQLGASFTAKAYEPMILEYGTYSVVKDMSYADGKVDVTLTNPLEENLFIRARVKCLKGNKLNIGGGISGYTKPGEDVHFKVDCAENDADEILLEIMSESGKVTEVWSIK